MKNVTLILGGTKEAAELAAELAEASPDARIIYSLAGRTKEPIPVAGEMRTGGFGGVDGLVDYIRTNGITHLIDATHPFAESISKNAQMAAKLAKISIDVRERKPWHQQAGDRWIKVHDLHAACEAIPANARVLLALGSQNIGEFASRSDVHFLIRMVDEPTAKLPFDNYTIELGKPSDVEHETWILKSHNISHIVCRNSGGSGAYSKIEAARALGVPVIIVDRN